MNNCKGCGVSFPEEREYCERCFRIKHYSDYKKVNKTNDEYEKILTEIGKQEDLVVLVVDLFMIPESFKDLKKLLKNDILLILTKRDVIPFRVTDDKLKDYVENFNLNIKDIEVISSKKNHNFDNLYEKINKYKKSNNVYVVGYTNAGKSTMINNLIYHYSDLSSDITTSIMPSTTLGNIEVKLNDELTLIDTPGLLVENSFMNEVDGKILKRIMPDREIKPKTYQIKGKQYIYIEDLCKMEIEDMNLTFFVSNKIKIERFFKEKNNLPFIKEIEVNDGEDLVIEGLGFIKCTKKGVIKLELLYDANIYTRKTLI
jgi:Predicted GTPases